MRSATPSVPISRSAPPSSQDLVAQGRSESRTLEETLDRGWRVASMLPRRELTMVSEQTLGRRYEEAPDAPARAAG